MNFAITAAIVAYLFCYAAGKFITDDPACRIIQGIIAVVAGVAIVLSAGWL